MGDKCNRRRFLRTSAGLAAAALTGGLAGCKQEEKPGPTPGAVVTPPKPTGGESGAGGDLLAAKVGENRWVGHPDPEVEVAVAEAMEPAALVNEAVEAYGGIGAFVHRGDTVVIKPNLAWSKGPDDAANTNPDVLAATIALCQAAGASEVLVVEHAINKTTITFEMSGAQDVCDAANVDLVDLDDPNYYREVPLAEGVNLTKDQIAEDILDCDCLIDIAVMKHHSGAEMCGCMKNLMGAVWDRQQYHAESSMLQKSENLHQCIVDLNTGLRPTLCILDAVRCLLTNGPGGPGEVKEASTVMVSTDAVALDTLGAELCGFDPSAVGHLTAGATTGLGKCVPDDIKVKRV